MGKLYEGMFLLDNQVVRADWGRAKRAVTDTLTKAGATVHTARHWEERKLAYPIRGHLRGTYLLCHFEVEGDGVNAMRRDLELDERILRYLIIRAEALPPGELEKSQAEAAADFSLPPPPQDESVSPEREAFGDLVDRPVHAPEPAEEEPAVEETGEVEPQAAAVAAAPAKEEV